MGKQALEAKGDEFILGKTIKLIKYLPSEYKYTYDILHRYIIYEYK